MCIVQLKRGVLSNPPIPPAYTRVWGVVQTECSFVMGIVCIIPRPATKGGSYRTPQSPPGGGGGGGGVVPTECSFCNGNCVAEEKSPDGCMYA